MECARAHVGVSVVRCVRLEPRWWRRIAPAEPVGIAPVHGVGLGSARLQSGVKPPHSKELPVDLNYGGGKLKDLSLDSTQMLMTRVFWLCAGSEFSFGNGEKGLTATVMITPLAPTGDLAWSRAKLFTGP